MKKRRLLFATLIAAICAVFGVFAVACGDNNPGEEQNQSTFSVVFNVQGHGTAPDTVRNLQSGAKVTKPTDPTAEGFVFEGWYKETACTNEWNFDTDTVTKSTILYAKWTEETFTFTYDVQGHGTAPAPVTGVKKNAVVQAADDPTAEGFIFLGWYKEAVCTNEWDFNTDTVTADTTVYAKWEAAHVVTIESAAQFAVDGLVYFTVPVEGQYRITTDGLIRGKSYKLDGGDFIVRYDGETEEYLAKGTHTMNVSTDSAFTATVAFDAYNLPLTDELTYRSTTYQLKVNSLSTTGLHAVAFGTFDNDNHDNDDLNNQIRAYSIVDGCYLAKVGEMNGSGAFKTDYEVKLKFVTTGNKVTSIEVYEREGTEWNTTVAETLTIPVYAKDNVKTVNYTSNSAGTSVNETIVDPLPYVYLDVAAWIGKWVDIVSEDELSIYWVEDINVGVNGSVLTVDYLPGSREPIDIKFDYSQTFRLLPAAGNEYTMIAVRPATGKTVSFTIKQGQIPAGLSDENPIVIADNKAVIKDADKSNGTYYLRFTPAAVGEYKVTATYNPWGTDYSVPFTLNGKEVTSGSRVQFDTTDPVAVVLNVSGLVTNDPTDITVEFVQIIRGTLESDAFRCTVSNATRVFEVNTEASTIKYSTILSNGASAVNGTYSYTEQGGVYSFTAGASTITFEVNADGSLAVDFGAQDGVITMYAYDLEAEAKLAGRYTARTDKNEVFVMFVKGSTKEGFKVDYYSEDFQMEEEDRVLGYVNGKYSFKYWYNQETATITINENGSLTVSGYNPMGNASDEITFTKTEFSDSLKPETYEYKDGDTTYTLAVSYAYGAYSVRYSGSTYSYKAYSNGKYSFSTYSGISVTITVVSDTELTVEGYNGTAGSSATFTVRTEVIELAVGTYTGKVYESDVILIVSKDGDNYFASFGDENGMMYPTVENLPITISNGKYVFTYTTGAPYDYNFEVQITVNSATSILVENIGTHQDSGTLTQEGGSEDEPTLTAGTYKYNNISITIKIDGSGNITVDFKGEVTANDIAVTESNGTYSFTVPSTTMNFEVTFTVLSKNAISVSGYSFGSGYNTTFQKEAEAGELVALQEGRWVLQTSQITYTIEIVSDGNGGFTASYSYNNFSGSGFAITTNANGYSFDASLNDGMFTCTVNFTLSEDYSTLTATSSNDSMGIGPNGELSNVAK